MIETASWLASAGAPCAPYVINGCFENGPSVWNRSRSPREAGAETEERGCGECLISPTIPRMKISEEIIRKHKVERRTSFMEAELIPNSLFPQKFSMRCQPLVES